MWYSLPFMGSLVRTLFAVWNPCWNTFIGLGAIFSLSITLCWSVMYSSQYFSGQYLWGSLIYVLSYTCIAYRLLALFRPNTNFSLFFYIHLYMNSRSDDSLKIYSFVTRYLLPMEETFPWVSLCFTCFLALSIGMFLVLQN